MDVALDYHGAIDFAELAALGIAADDVIDFSVNSNPFGPVNAVREAVAGARLSRYPDKACLALREMLAGHLGVEMGQITVGNGSAENLFNIAFATLSKGDSVLIVGPTFGEYARNARLMEAQVHMWQAQPETEFVVDVAAIGEQLHVIRPKLFHLCNPNNPTGQVVSAETISSWANTYPDTLFVIDEAYAAFAQSFVSMVRQNLPNVLVLRSMTKDFSLAGLRLGYVVGPAELAQAVASVAVPWSVSEVAQAAGISAISSYSKYKMQWSQLQKASVEFIGGLRRLGFRPNRSHTHFFLMKVGDGRAFRSRLLRQGLLVRLCESYGLPQFVRIATQLPEQNATLLAALEREERRNESGYFF